MELTRYAESDFGRAERLPGPYGYVAYLPRQIPTEVDLPRELWLRLTDAEAALGRLAGMAPVLPDPHLFVRPYLAREAVASTRIEGTQASLDQLFELEAAGESPGPDLEEVINYVRALEHGVRRLADLPISRRLVCEMHAELLAGVRGRERSPGEFRTTQNWIGAPGATIETALFVPPPSDRLDDLFGDWERFANAASTLPVLVKVALLHYQFETLHPFLDGNGRLGRLLIPLQLVVEGRLPSPMLYLSPWIEANRDRYYDALQGVRERGALDGWLAFFLDGIIAQATDAVARAHRLLALRDAYRQQVLAARRQAVTPVIDLLMANPVLTARLVQQRVNVSRPTALTYLRTLGELGILARGTEGSRGQERWNAHEVLRLLLTERVQEQD